MNRFVFLVVLLVFVGGCASSDDRVSERFYDCEENRDVSIDVALNQPTVAFERTTDQLTMVVDVGNNLSHDIEVRAIRVEPVDMEYAHYVLERSYREFGRVIPGGESHAFELPVLARAMLRDPMSERRESALGVVVSVYMANGDTYRCKLFTPAPR